MDGDVQPGADGSWAEFMAGFGYRLLPATYPGCSGALGLVVAIRAEPTEEHFDPEEVTLRLRDLWGMASWKELTRRSGWLPSDRVCPGRVLLSDRHGERTEFFTYGGTLTMEDWPETRIYALRSPAPVLSVDPLRETWCDEVASETECRIAEAAARWHGDEQGFLRRLAEVDPLETYVAAVHSILVEHGGSSGAQRFYHKLDEVLRGEREWLKEQGLWPEQLVKIEDLLAPRS
ncbi:MAG: hypothetical protein JXA93_02855 [Anaerolineae bacterium]|nr:hypothetical protein [Anaerolineae bacterium]